MRKILRKKATEEKVGLSGTTIWRLEKKGLFPKRVQLGGKNVGWFDHETDEYLENCPRGIARRETVAS